MADLPFRPSQTSKEASKASVDSFAHNPVADGRNVRGVRLKNSEKLAAAHLSEATRRAV
jgi:hypothetical protein